LIDIFFDEKILVALVRGAKVRLFSGRKICDLWIIIAWVCEQHIYATFFRSECVEKKKIKEFIFIFL